MNRVPILWGLHAAPPRIMIWFLASISFILVIVLYVMASHTRLTENPQDKLLPSFAKMADAVKRTALLPDRRTGKYLLVADTLSSLKRIGIGIALAATTGLLLGVNMGLFPGMRSLLLAFITFMSNIPPLALLPMLFITFGVGELGKVMLIFIGTLFPITRSVYLATQQIPKEHITKALTLGASQLQVVYSVVLPQVIPRLIDATRISLGAAWLFLIAAEAIASTDGLGYRIFLVRRYLAMDVIIPYVLWITCLAFGMDWLLRKVVARRYAWYLAART